MNTTATGNLRELIRKEVSEKRSRFFVHGGEGTGKTTFVANFPKPFGILARGETGYDTLRERGLVPQVDTAPEVKTYKELQAWIQYLLNEDHDYEWLFIDGMGSVERMFADDLIARHYKDDDDFHDFGRGWKRGGPAWDGFLGTLDKLREDRDMGVCLVAHSRATMFNNPKGEDYHRWTPDMSDRPLNITVRWADAVLFFDFVDSVSKVGRKPKGIGGSKKKVIHTQRTASHVAKERHGLPETISLGNDGKEGFDNFMTALIEGKKI